MPKKSFKPAAPSKTRPTKMQKVTIKRIKHSKKKPTIQEKVLAVMGVGSSLLGGASAISPQPKTTEFVSTNEGMEGAASSKIKATLQRIFGVGEAQAAGADSTPYDVFSVNDNQGRASLAAYVGTDSDGRAVNQLVYVRGNAAYDANGNPLQVSAATVAAIIARAPVSEARVLEIMGAANTLSYGVLTPAEQDAVTAYLNSHRTAITDKNFQTFAPGSIMAWALSMGSSTELNDAARSLGFVRFDSQSGMFVKTSVAAVSVAGNIPAATVGKAYSGSVAATGGTGSYTYAIKTGALPAGLSLSSGGLITGTPTGAAGNYNFTVEARDSAGKTFQSLVLSLTVTAAQTATAGTTITITGQPGKYDGVPWAAPVEFTNAYRNAYLNFQSYSITVTTSAQGVNSYEVSATTKSGQTYAKTFTDAAQLSNFVVSNWTTSNAFVAMSDSDRFIFFAIIEAGPRLPGYNPAELPIRTPNAMSPSEIVGRDDNGIAYSRGISPTLLSTQEEAKVWQQRFPGSVIIEQQPAMIPTDTGINWNDPRRLYALKMPNGSIINVGTLGDSVYYNNGSAYLHYLDENIAKYFKALPGENWSLGYVETSQGEVWMGEGGATTFPGSGTGGTSTGGGSATDTPAPSTEIIDSQSGLSVAQVVQIAKTTPWQNMTVTEQRAFVNAFVNGRNSSSIPTSFSAGSAFAYFLGLEGGSGTQTVKKGGDGNMYQLQGGQWSRVAAAPSAGNLGGTSAPATTGSGAQASNGSTSTQAEPSSISLVSGASEEAAESTLPVSETFSTLPAVQLYSSEPSGTFGPSLAFPEQSAEEQAGVPIAAASAEPVAASAEAAMPDAAAAQSQYTSPAAQSAVSGGANISASAVGQLHEHVVQLRSQIAQMQNQAGQEAAANPQIAILQNEVDRLENTIAQLQSPAEQQEAEEAESEALASGTYTVKKGDTLWSISKKYYGDGKKWRKILEANTRQVKNPQTLAIGTILIIPDIAVK